MSGSHVLTYDLDGNLLTTIDNKTESTCDNLEYTIQLDGEPPVTLFQTNEDHRLCGAPQDAGPQPSSWLVLYNASSTENVDFTLQQFTSGTPAIETYNLFPVENLPDEPKHLIFPIRAGGERLVLNNNAHIYLPESIMCKRCYIAIAIFKGPKNDLDYDAPDTATFAPGWQMIFPLGTPGGRTYLTKADGSFTPAQISNYTFASPYDTPSQLQFKALTIQRNLLATTCDDIKAFDDWKTSFYPRPCWIPPALLSTDMGNGLSSGCISSSTGWGNEDGSPNMIDSLYPQSYQVNAINTSTVAGQIDNSLLSNYLVQAVDCAVDIIHDCSLTAEDAFQNCPAITFPDGTLYARTYSITRSYWAWTYVPKDPLDLKTGMKCVKKHIGFQRILFNIFATPNVIRDCNLSDFKVELTYEEPDCEEPCDSCCTALLNVCPPAMTIDEWKAMNFQPISGNAALEYKGINLSVLSVIHFQDSAGCVHKFEFPVQSAYNGIDSRTHFVVSTGITRQVFIDGKTYDMTGTLTAPAEIVVSLPSPSTTLPVSGGGAVTANSYPLDYVYFDLDCLSGFEIGAPVTCLPWIDLCSNFLVVRNQIAQLQPTITSLVYASDQTMTVNFTDIYNCPHVFVFPSNGLSSFSSSSGDFTLIADYTNESQGAPFTIDGNTGIPPDNPDADGYLFWTAAVNNLPLPTDGSSLPFGTYYPTYLGFTITCSGGTIEFFPPQIGGTRQDKKFIGLQPPKNLEQLNKAFAERQKSKSGMRKQAKVHPQSKTSVQSQTLAAKQQPASVLSRSTTSTKVTHAKAKK